MWKTWSFNNNKIIEANFCKRCAREWIFYIRCIKNCKITAIKEIILYFVAFTFIALHQYYQQDTGTKI